MLSKAATLNQKNSYELFLVILTQIIFSLQIEVIQRPIYNRLDIIVQTAFLKSHLKMDRLSFSSGIIFTVVDL